MQCFLVLVLIAQHQHLRVEWMSKRRVTRYVYWVSRGLSVAGRLWPSAWLNQHLCGVPGHLRESLAHWAAGKNFNWKDISGSLSTLTVSLFYWSIPLQYCMVSLPPTSSCPSVWDEPVIQENPRFTVTLTYVYYTYQFKDVLYSENHWACKLCGLYARLMDKSPFLNCLMEYSLTFFSFSKSRG